MEYTLDFTSQEDWEIVAEEASKASEEWSELDDPEAVLIGIAWFRVAKAIDRVEQLIAKREA